jgi:hypothetical protein
MDILHQAKGDHLGRVHSDQMVLETIRRGRLVRRAIAQQRPKVSKLGLKGLSDCHSNESAVEAARRGACGLNKKGYSQEIFTKKGELENSSRLD